MRTILVGTFAALALGLVGMASLGQPPEEKGKPPFDKKGGEFDKKKPFDKKGPPGFVPGKVLPPHVRDLLDLTPEQDKKIRELEDEVRGKLQRILTEDQIRRISELKDKGPKGPPDGKDFPDKGKKKKDGPPDDR